MGTRTSPGHRMSTGAVKDCAAIGYILTLLAFLCLCVCWVFINAHSITELAAPTSLSHYYLSRFTSLRIEEEQTDCQSGPPLKRYISHIFEEQPRTGVPYTGQCLNVGSNRGPTHMQILVVHLKNAVACVWPVGCTPQNCMRTKRI